MDFLENHDDVLYALRDPRDGAIRYLGVTNNIKRRMKSHVYDCRVGDHHRARWWRAAKAESGHAPTLDILLRCGGLDWRTVEPFFIISGRYLGLSLTNSSDGGHGIRNPTPELIAKRKLSDEARARISAALTGRKCSPEAVARSSAGRTGKKRSLETRALLSALARARSPFTDEHCAHISAGKKNPSAETLARMSEASKNRTPEWRANHSAAVRGQKRTAEVREKIRIGTLAAWQRRNAKKLASR